jgi:hypothetical protein
MLHISASWVTRITGLSLASSNFYFFIPNLHLPLSLCVSPPPHHHHCPLSLPFYFVFLLLVTVMSLWCKLKGRKRYFGPFVQLIQSIGYLSQNTWGEHHGGGSQWQSKSAHIMAERKQIRFWPRTKYPQGPPSSDLLPPARPHLLKPSELP